MYRNEFKYIIDPATARIISKRIGLLLNHDNYADDDGFYRVSSLYFDDYDNNALNDNIIGQIRRKKYRIRIYNGQDKLIKLEKKTKHSSGGMKASYKLSMDQYRMILEGAYATLKKSSDDPLIQEFSVDGIQKRLKPKVIVDYDRQSFVYRFGTVRITFDYNVKHAISSIDMFDRETMYIPALNSKQIIMEVKYTGFLPSHIKSLLQQSVSSRQSISKYTLCRSMNY